MEIGKFVQFEEFSIGPKPASTIKFSVAGGDTMHYAVINERGWGIFGGRKIVPDANAPDIWKPLLAEPFLELPQRCETCPDDQQTFYWRTFTDKSLAIFKTRQGKGSFFTLTPDKSGSDHEGDEHQLYLADTQEINAPGILWFTKLPAFALAMGITRLLSENIGVHLLGVNVCTCDLNAGTEVYSARPAGNVTVLTKTTPQTLPRISDLAWEDVVSNVTQPQTERGVAYLLNPQLLAPVQEAVREAEWDVRRLKHFSDRWDHVLNEMAEQDPAVGDVNHLNALTSTWKPFLIQTSTALFAW